MLRFARSRVFLSLLISFSVVLLIAGMTGCTNSAKGKVEPAGASSGAAAPPAAGVRYHCPMHPNVISDRPGNCPICGMKLVPIDEKRQTPAAPHGTSAAPGKNSAGHAKDSTTVEQRGDRATVAIPVRKQQLIGVRTGPVKRIPFVRTIRTVGRVVVDETRLHHVHTKVDGWVEDLYVNSTGQRVARGEPLLSLYSPEILATQEEYLLALRTRRALGEGALPETVRRADEMVESGKRRLLLYDLSPAQIEALETKGEPSRYVRIYSPVSGYVLMRNVNQGHKITPDDNLLDVADLSRVWVLASVYEYELPYVKEGQPATMTLSYLPGKTYSGKVGLIYPVLDSASRTVQVRLESENREMDLRPEMYADVVLHSDLGTRLAVPQSAIIASGTRNVVFVAQGNGYFQPREVRLGLRLDDMAEVLDGLSEGETVVTSGNFLIDSESRMKAALEAVAPPEEQ